MWTDAMLTEKAGPIITVDHLRKTYGTTVAVDDVNCRREWLFQQAFSLAATIVMAREGRAERYKTCLRAWPISRERSSRHGEWRM